MEIINLIKKFEESVTKWKQLYDDIDNYNKHSVKDMQSWFGIICRTDCAYCSVF